MKVISQLIVGKRWKFYVKVAACWLQSWRQIQKRKLNPLTLQPDAVVLFTNRGLSTMVISMDVPTPQVSSQNIEQMEASTAIAELSNEIAIVDTSTQPSPAIAAPNEESHEFRFGFTRRCGTHFYSQFPNMIRTVLDMAGR